MLPDRVDPFSLDTFKDLRVLPSITLLVSVSFRGRHIRSTWRRSFPNEPTYCIMFGTVCVLATVTPPYSMEAWT